MGLHSEINRATGGQLGMLKNDQLPLLNEVLLFVNPNCHPKLGVAPFQYQVDTVNTQTLCSNWTA